MNKKFAKTQLVAAITALVFSAGAAGNGFASEVSLQGRPTPRTPFDRKVESAGFFSHDYAVRSMGGGNSAGNWRGLFKTAVRMRYISDRRKDRWQTAEARRHTI